jgi:uncharacterized protein (TIGR03083 family)
MTDRAEPLTYDRYCEEIAAQAQELEVLVASGADLSATVPTCPDWTLEQLVRHVGSALRWAELMVRTRAVEMIPGDRVPGAAGPEARGDAPALAAWMAESGERLARTLREAGPDAEVWGWAGTRTAGFWARRMTHELAVHRADAVLAAGLPYRVAPEIAADALDEWLGIVAYLQRNAPGEATRELLGRTGSIHLHATDTDAALDAEWTIELTGEGVVWRRGHEKATVALRGPLTSVLLAFYRRLPLDSPGLDVLGERGLLEFWLERASFD